MALGADTLAAEEVLAMRECRPAVRLIAALPCPGQEARWPLADKERYRALLAQADLCVTACPAYTPYAMHARNRWMVEHTSRLIAIFDGSPGGTAHTVRLAEAPGAWIFVSYLRQPGSLSPSLPARLCPGTGKAPSEIRRRLCDILLTIG